MKMLIILIFICGTLFAQTENLISLAQCIQISEKNSYSLKAKSQEIEATRSVFRQNHSSYFPGLSIEGSHDQYFYNQYNFRAQSIGVAADWQLGEFLLKSASANQIEVSAKEAAYENIRLSIIHRIGMLYISLLQNDFQQKQMQNQSDLLGDHLKINQAMWKAGIRPKLDILQTQSAQNQVIEEILKLESDKESLRQELEELLNWKENSKLKPIPFSNLPFGMDTSGSSVGEELLALNQNPSFKILGLQARAQEFRRRQINAMLLPNLHFFGGYVADADPTSDGNYKLFSIGLQMPLFQWGRSKFQKQEFLADAHSLEFEQSDLLRELRIEMKQVNTQYHQLVKTLQIQMSQIVISQQAFEMASANYEAGLITNLEFLSAQKTLNDYQIAINETQLEIILNRIHLYTLTNQPGKIAGLQGE